MFSAPSSTCTTTKTYFSTSKYIQNYTDIERETEKYIHWEAAHRDTESKTRKLERDFRERRRFTDSYAYKIIQIDTKRESRILRSRTQRYGIGDERIRERKGGILERERQERGLQFLCVREYRVGSEEHCFWTFKKKERWGMELRGESQARAKWYCGLCDTRNAVDILKITISRPDSSRLIVLYLCNIKNFYIQSSQPID